MRNSELLMHQSMLSRGEGWWAGGGILACYPKFLSKTTSPDNVF